MPIFEYLCMDCGEKFEKLVFNFENINCPNCGGSNVKKLISKFSSPGLDKGGCSSCSVKGCSGCGR